jgi:hypothetical protein
MCVQTTIETTNRWRADMAKFEVGKTYYDRSICDHNCIFSFEIISRTAKQVTIKQHGKISKRGLTVYDGVEQFKPFGSYSMCAIVRADKELTGA